MLLGLSCKPLALRHSKSASFGGGSSLLALICIGCPSFGVWLKPVPNPPQHHPAPAPCTSRPQFDLYWAAAPGLVRLPSGVWTVPGAPLHWECPLLPARGIPSPHSPPWSTSKLLLSPGSTSTGWEETEPCQNLLIFHERGKKTQQQSFSFFSPPSLTLLIRGFWLDVLLLPPTLPPVLSGNQPLANLCL